MSLVEIDDSPYKERQEYTLGFIESNSAGFIGKNRFDEVEKLVGKIMLTGIKKKDSTHLACSIIAECNYFITTDKRILKYKTNRIKIVSPVNFVEI